MNVDNPRKIAFEQLKKSLNPEIWQKNSQFISEIKKELSKHPINNHPIINLLNKGVFNHAEMQKIHLEYRHAIVKIFTDALLMTQFQTKELEPRFPAGIKMIPRFLITLNILDEFGFSPGYDSNKYYQGNPNYAHYPLFEKLLDDYQLTVDDRNNYKPSDISNMLKDFLESTYDNYLLLSALLATAEVEVMLFSPPLMQNSQKLGIDTTLGYYYYHGSSEETDTDAYDDDHEEDLWNILIHAIEPKDYQYVKSRCLEYCDLWVTFWDYQLGEHV